MPAISCVCPKCEVKHKIYFSNCIDNGEIPKKFCRKCRLLLKSGSSFSDLPLSFANISRSEGNIRGRE